MIHNVNNGKKLKIFTWHIHGSYLYYLTQGVHSYYLPVDDRRSEGYVGRTKNYQWSDNVIEIPKERVKNQKFDLIIFQSKKNYFDDQYEVLSPEQRKLPRIYLEHDPPRQHPTDTVHPVTDSGALIVHVTHFNKLMWDTGNIPVMVIEHGIMPGKKVSYTGKKNRGIVVVNDIRLRGRRLGWDIYQKVKQVIPLDLYGMGWNEAGGVGEIPHDLLPEVLSRYRFFFNPIRYTSLGLSVCEALCIGLPVVAVKTAEISTVIENGFNGFADTDVDRLISYMSLLLSDRSLALRLSANTLKTSERFSIGRFLADWDMAFKTAKRINTEKLNEKSLVETDNLFPMSPAEL